MSNTILSNGKNKFCLSGREHGEANGSSVFIKAIETLYKGWRFRSRLEARWAIFFDALKIKWEYEPEGFRFNKTTYLPDFFLPTFDGGMYCEVKPEGGDFSKAYEFARSGARIMLCEGVPTFRVYSVLEGLRDNVEWKSGPDGVWREEKTGTQSLFESVGIPNAGEAFGQDRMLSFPEYENDDGSISEAYHAILGQGFIDAVMTVRKTRFQGRPLATTKTGSTAMIQVRLTLEEKAQAILLGNGNASAGLRLALAMAMQTDGEIEGQDDV